jgi:DNA-binding response OmpR family regulator
MKILVLDDNEALSKAVQTMLKLHGHDVDAITNAKDGVKMVEEGTYDIILVDYKMPVNDGIWFMKEARIPRNTKVLLMTAFVNKDVINEMFSLGAVGYLVKPFDDAELMRHIEFHTSG